MRPGPSTGKLNIIDTEDDTIKDYDYVHPRINRQTQNILKKEDQSFEYVN